MQRNFYTDDFEQLIRQKADQYKMYPSDHVWKGVHRALHGRRRWYWAGFAVLLLCGGFFSANYLLKENTVNPLAAKMQPSLTATQQAQQSRVPTAENLNQNDALSNQRPEQITAVSPFSVRTSSIESSIPFVTNAANESGTSPIEDAALMSRKLNGTPELKIQSLADFQRTSVLLPEFADAASESAQKSEQQVNWLEENAVYQLTP